MLHNFTAGNKFRCPKQKQFEQSEFSGSQRDCLFVARGAPAVAVECEVGVAKPCVAAMKAAANQRPDPGQEFRENKWLRQIVIRARIKALNPLLDQTSCGKHHHRRLNSTLTQLPADFDPAEVG